VGRRRQAKLIDIGVLGRLPDPALDLVLGSPGQAWSSRAMTGLVCRGQRNSLLQGIWQRNFSGSRSKARSPQDWRSHVKGLRQILCA